MKLDIGISDATDIEVHHRWVRHRERFWCFDSYDQMQVILLFRIAGHSFGVTALSLAEAIEDARKLAEWVAVREFLEGLEV